MNDPLKAGSPLIERRPHLVSRPRADWILALSVLCLLLGEGAFNPALARQHRSQVAKHRFEVQTGYPHGRPGYVIDHFCPLACGGEDAPINMQWQSDADGKAKDRIERNPCSRFCSVPCPACGH